MAATGGFELGAGTLLGFGTVSEASGGFSSGGTIEASNGTLDIRNTIGLQPVLLKTDANGVLKIDGTATSPRAIEFVGGGRLEIGVTGSLNISTLKGWARSN